MTSELKPCPFCGSGYIDTGCLTVGCCRCGANGPEGYEGVTETWNDRPIEDALRAEVEQLRLGVMTASERAGKYHAEVEALKAANFNIAVCGAHATSQEPAGCVLCEVARLQAELEKYTQPLTKDQACDVASSYGLLGYSPTCAERFDAAIRAAREGAR